MISLSQIRSFLATGAAIALHTAIHAASVTSSSTAPAINDADLANYGAVSGTDKWWGTSGGNNDGRGQTFTTGQGALRLKSITYQTSTSTIPTKVFTIRVGKVTGTTFTQTYSETATQSTNWGSNHYVTWTFANPPILDGGTVYGVDVIMSSSTTDWQTGIPYLNVTDNEFAGGAQYLSGSGGSYTALSTGDRIFHLNMETPLSAGFDIVAGNPPDNATGVLIRPEIVATFSRNLVVGTGNITIRNLTDATDAVIAVTDPAVSIGGNLLKIQTAGLINYGKSYAIRIDPTALKDANENFYLGIADDITWNFAVAPSDPFLTAVTSLKNHYNGTAPLTTTQIATVFDTIVVNKLRFSESPQTIAAVFGLVAAYDAAKGSSALLSTGINFGDRNTQAKTADWTAYQVMQTIVDEIYTPTVLANHESLLVGFKLGVSAHFPGSCPLPAAGVTRTVTINASFPDTFGRDTQMWTTPARKPTGTYLSPGTVATVTVPAALVNAGYKIRVGCHSWDLESRRNQVKRLDRATVIYPITSTSIKVASPYGGGIYIEVPFRASAGEQSVTVSGAVRSAYFSKKSFHTTTVSEWLTERAYLAPWADFQTDKYMTQVPRKWIYNNPDPTAAMNDWDLAMDAINDLMGFPRLRGKETMYCQADIILRSSVHAPGYPAINNSTNPNSEVSPTGNAGNYLIRGPRASTTAAHIEFHEQGHAYGFPKFGGESESNVNLLQPAMLNRAFGYSFDVAHRSSLGSTNTFRTINNTAVAWMCVFNFSPREVPMDDSEKAYQHKGHAKFLDIARLFGWTGLDNFWKSFMQDNANGVSYGSGTDDLLLRLSRHVGKDIRPLFHFWGIHPQNPSALAAAMAAANIPTSLQIRDQLLVYKSLIPANNAAFRTFALAWWGKQPNFSTGAWEEREHARQWDTTALYGAGDQQRSEATNPGEIYNENSALDINNRVQELLDLYFPSAITPSTMTFTVQPTVINATTIGMTATTATAAAGPIEYFFNETTGNAGGTDSAWQTSPVYEDSGLTPGLTYTYNVTARDGLGNVSNVSLSVSVTPTAAGDILPPTPSPMVFASLPNALDEDTITMTALSAADVNGVEYYFENITNSKNSGWQDSPIYTETLLLPATAYSYRVRARDKSANQNVTAFSAAATARTDELPDLSPPQIVSLLPLDGSLVVQLGTNLVMTFDEPVIAGNGSITLKNLTDGTEADFDVNAAEVVFAGNTITLNPPTNLVFGKLYAVQLSSGAVVDISSNPFVGITDDAGWNFTAILAEPIANIGGPYIVPTGVSLTLDASNSHPSHLQTITAYTWDLNNDGTFGDVTGPTPAALTDTALMANWGLVLGSNTIGLRVTDSANMTAIASTTVRLGISLAWDANGTGANQTDGAGAWLSANQWRDGSTNRSWISGAAVSIGNGGTGGSVSLGSPTTAASLAFNAFTGTYTLGSSGQALTVNSGITKNSGSGIATLASPVILGGPQTWTNNSSADLSVSGGLNNAGHTLTIAGSGSTALNTNSNIISGAGGIIMNGTGRLTLGSNPGPTHTYSGPTTINNGALLISNNLPGGNLTITGGYLDFYFGGTFSRALGSSAGQVRVTGGTSGFSNNGSTGGTIRFNNNAATEIVWGSANFNPSTLILQASTAQNSSSLTLDNKIDLNGANRTISTSQTTGTGAGSATLSQIIRNSQATPAGLIKIGSGRLNLNAANTYNGGTTLLAGTLQLGNAAGLGAASGPLTINGGLLNLNDQTISVGNLSGTGGTIANNGNAARTLTIGSGNSDGGVYQGVIANKTGTGTGTVALTKTGSGSVTLAGLNTYTGATSINGGGTLFLTGATQATTSIVFASNGKLGLAIGSPVTAATAAVNFANGTITVTGTPSAPSHTLLTALSFTGTPVLTSPIPGYKLQVIGNQLQLNQIVTDPYAVWSSGATFTLDANKDGIDNGIAFLLGASTPTGNALSLMPTITQSGGNLLLAFDCLPAAERGTAILNFEYSSDLSIPGTWANVPVPGTVGTSTVGNVNFTITDPGSPGGLLHVVASVPASPTRLFYRLTASQQ